MLRVYPQADVFALVNFLTPEDTFLPPHTRVETSFLQQFPFSKKHFRQYLALMPLAVEQFDLSAYDLVLSSHHAVAKGVITRPDQLHISYVHTPMRYAWDLQHQYLQQARLNRGLKTLLARPILHYLRLWDTTSAARVDTFAANSRFIAKRIQKFYRRKSQVIYPPVAIHRFQGHAQRESFYLTVSRCVPYKRVDLTVQAFNQLGLPLVVIGEGPGLASLKRSAKANITFLGYQPDPIVADYMARCKAFVYAAEEDFGITVLEAQAAGSPVIALGRGGTCETVKPHETGLLFFPQTVESLVETVKQFDEVAAKFDPQVIRFHATAFGEEQFRQKFRSFIQEIMLKFQRGDALE